METDNGGIGSGIPITLEDIKEGGEINWDAAEYANSSSVVLSMPFGADSKECPEHIFCAYFAYLARILFFGQKKCIFCLFCTYLAQIPADSRFQQFSGFSFFFRSCIFSTYFLHLIRAILNFLDHFSPSIFILGPSSAFFFCQFCAILGHSRTQLGTNCVPLGCVWFDLILLS